MNDASVYKILTDAEMTAFKASGIFKGNLADNKDGYIHLSEKSQVERVIEKYYKDVSPLWVAEFRGTDFLDKLKWEPASNGDLYPHLYGSFLKYVDVARVQSGL